MIRLHSHKQWTVHYSCSSLRGIRNIGEMRVPVTSISRLLTCYFILLTISPHLLDTNACRLTKRTHYIEQSQAHVPITSNTGQRYIRTSVLCVANDFCSHEPPRIRIRHRQLSCICFVRMSGVLTTDCTLPIRHPTIYQKWPLQLQYIDLNCSIAMRSISPVNNCWCHWGIKQFKHIVAKSKTPCTKVDKKASGSFVEKG